MATEYQAVKRAMETWGPLDGASLHITVGVIALLLAAFVLRKPITSPWPLLIVAILQLANEAMDFLVHRLAYPAIQGGEAIRDTVLTLFLPAMIVAAARLAPHIFCPADARDYSDEDDPD